MAGSFSSRRRISASRPRGQSGRCQEGATGGVFRCWPMIATDSSPRKGGRPVSHLVEHRAERVEVTPWRHFAAHGLLRRHVGDRADHHPGLGQAASVGGHGEAEVADLGPAILR